LGTESATPGSDCTASGGGEKAFRRIFLWNSTLGGLKACSCRRAIAALPGELSIAITSNRRGHGQTRCSVRKCCAVRAKRCRLPSVTLQVR